MLRTDEQTIKDLGIFGSRDGSGIFDIYNQSHTRGGETLLERIFLHPLSSREAINTRSKIIESFARSGLGFPYDAAMFDMAEKYLNNNKGNPEQKNSHTTLGEKEIQNGVTAVLDLVRISRDFIENPEVKAIAAYAAERNEIAELLSDPSFGPALKTQSKEKLSYSAITAYDALFRVSGRDKIGKLLNYIYYLDVYISVGQTAVTRKFIFPKALPKGSCELSLEGVFHPALKEPVGNDISMGAAHNIIFLTGANMAGKSTFLRAVSTALYIAHTGFPVAAKAMSFSVLDGMYTTVNLPDNLGIGASHFYAEVQRVKKVATELSSGKSFFILFDELFRGTNVKDAHEATVAVIKGFAKNPNSLFIISSHIVEAGDDLQEKKNVRYFFLPTRMNGHLPEYTYTLEQGITNDRHGMIIIRNEGILEILKNGKKIHS
ncbi:MutS-related protein [Pseudoflavitalea rhizosphaerae]|uniref:MutS-related protein n=1 Tax=Pseudoflavitalea rhizosphaerae TaxID=1884793 RepID=UPI000F8E2480|nr:DNA mismatch repair protein [Pseudoflavitalea rhizosphaerae]